jgi:N-acyl amino acid synthase of PEP-CTERM/exosortase system
VEASTGQGDLGKRFEEFFELLPAFDDASLDQVFRIRHDVYCRDLGWEPLRPDGRETDEFDRHSFHCLLRRRDSHDPVGCTRLIVCRPEDPAFPLPLEESCREVLDRTIADPARMARDSLGEVSRLAVVGAFRQRRGESSSPLPLSDADFQSRGPTTRFPFIPVSLYLGITAIARHLAVEHVFVLTEPRLASHFSRIGFDIRPVGGTIEHRGIRVPSLLSSSKVVEGLRPLIRPLYTVIERAVEDAFAVRGRAPW